MKNQIKKSLSLFMAVLMVLSCWVCVAPIAAEAITTTNASNSVTPTDKYTIKLGYDVTDPLGVSGKIQFKVWYYTKNGYGSASSSSVTIEDSRVTSAGRFTTTATEIDGFPYYIECAVYRSVNTSTSQDIQHAISWDEVWVGNGTISVDLFSNNFTMEQRTANSWTVAKAWLINGYSDPSGDAEATHNETTVTMPFIAGFDSATSSDINLTLNKIGGDPVSGGTSITTGTYFDQYGVKWAATVPSNPLSNLTAQTPYVSATENGTAVNETIGAAIYYDNTDDSATKGKVVATADLQTVSTSVDNGTYTGYLVHKYTCTDATGDGEITSQISAKINVTYQKHTVTVNGGGSIAGLDYTLNLTEGSTKDIWSTDQYYGKTVSPVPDGTASAAGYTFKNLWTREQPDFGDASYNAIASDFIEPISNEKFNEYKEDGGEVADYTYTDADGKAAKVPDEEGNPVQIITYNDKVYYNAGEQWNPKTHNKITYEDTFYGWWLSKDMVIKFYDINGKFLGTRNVKYGQTQDDITWPIPTESFVSGPYTYSNFSGIWVNSNGDEIDQADHTFTKELILTPKYDISVDNKYTVKFVNELNGDALNDISDTDNIDGTEYAYRTDLAAAGAIPADRPVPATIKNDLQYSYTFEGWSVQAPASGNYHILIEDGDFDTNGTAISYKTPASDWIVRSDVTYYPVFRRHLRSYAVNFWYKDGAGNDVSRQVTLKYGEDLKAPTDYVPYNYASEGKDYEFKEWKYTDASNDPAVFGYDKSVKFTKENITFTLAAENDGDDVKPVGIVAGYFDGVPMPYTVTFKYKNDKGEDVTKTAQVNHGSLITDTDVAMLAPAAEYDDGEAMVHFMDDWKVVEGAAAKEEYATSELTSFSPTSHITFEAVYGNPQPFYTVIYVDGANTFSQRVLQGANLPAWTIKVNNDNGTPDDPSDDTTDDTEYLPTMAETAQGYYTFLGWFDEKQTDTTYAEPNGTQYDAIADNEIESTVNGNLTLYPQFKFSPFTYEIKFMDYKGENVLAGGKYVYGADLTDLVAIAEEEAEKREGDNTYTYLFLGWDNPVPTFCEGHDITFTAQYKPVYKYYNAKWYNSVLVDGKWTADKSTKTEDDKTVETALLATSKHTYNSKVYSPSVAAECKETAPEGQNYVFAGWYYNDAEGNAQPYVRGMLITADMEFYATFKLTAKVHTVTAVVKEETSTYKAEDGSKVDKTIADPVAGYVDETKHDEFAGWYTTSGFVEGTEFDIATATITSDIKIYAKFIESEHDYEGNEEIVKAPTYYEKGEKNTWCSCDATLTAKTAEIPLLTDEVKPTGTIYLGTQGSWSSTGTPANETDNDPISLFVNKNTSLIITTNDTGDVDPLYNPSGIGKGIANIRAFAFPANEVLTADSYAAALEVAVTVFEDDTDILNNTANYSIKLGELYVADLAEDGSVQYEDDGTTVKREKLQDGEAYIIYYYVTDKAGNRLDRLVRTAKFLYDNTAPSYTVEGKKNTELTPTYCDKAIVTGIEDGATLTVNGVAVNIVWDTKTVDEKEVTTGSYEITDAGNYLVTVTDGAGNKTSKKFIVNDDHTYDVKEVKSTCTEDGYKTEKCIVCGYEKSKVDYEAPGHVTSHVLIPATCEENGYVLITCANCDYEEIFEFEVDENGEFILDEDGEKIPAFPALGHNYDMENGEIVYTVITAATCKTTGKEIATCKDCGETISRDIAIDPDAHNWGTTKTIKATCTESGKTYKTCKLCYTTVDVDTLDATGHEETQWVVTTAATCGAEGVETLQCKKCKAYVDGDDEDTVADTRAIPATGRHILAVSEDPTKTFEATADKEGQITRYCTQCGQEWVEKVAKIEKYTVTFVDEDGTTVIKTIADVVSGTTLEKSVVAEPTKDNSEDGKYKYTFAGWKDANGSSVTLPVDVISDMTLKASYTESTIIYTHEFLVPNTWVSPLAEDGYETFATMMGAMGDKRSPVAEPKFSLADKEADAELKKLYTFKFLGWSTTGAKGDIVTDFTIAGDTTFYAVFEAIAIAYDVIFYNGTSLVWNTTVDGGETVAFGGTEPTKNFDADYHYAFDTWYTDNSLKTAFDFNTAITAKTTLYAGFTATAHEWKKDAESADNKAATCTEAAKVAYKCDCGATKVVSEGEKNGHTPADAVKEEINGANYSVVYCSVCGEKISSTKTSVTVSFKNWNGNVEYYKVLDIGDAIVYEGDEPTRATDAQNTYEFAGWYVEGDATETIVTDFGTAQDNIVFIAKYDATARTFRVTYVDLDNNTLQTTDGLVYGDEVPAYTGSTATLVKKSDSKVHWTFEGWSVEAGAEVTTDIVIKPVFVSEAHDFETTSSEATCDKAGSEIKKCKNCDYSYEGENVPATGHKYNQTSRVEPNYVTGTDGYILYTCEKCNGTYKETLSAALTTVNVTIKDSNGAARVGVEVALFNSSDVQVGTATTNESGVATFKVAPGSYYATVVGSGERTDISVSESGKVTGGNVTVEAEKAPGCTCTCHKTTFWAILFRLFHKFIKLFTGKINCCDDPHGY